MKKYMSRGLICLISLLLIVAGFSVVNAGALTVNAMFKDNAVLQRNIQVPVWGTATAGAPVTVVFGGQSVAATTGGDGKWMAYLAPMAASTAPSAMTITGDGSTITVNNVQIGEVWVGSGQSNMNFSLTGSVGGPEAVADSGNYNITFYQYATGVWKRSSPSTSGDFSAILFYFGRELARHQLANVPIGFYQGAQNGSKIETWTTAMGGVATNYIPIMKPIQPYAIRGAIWYQGEGNAGGAAIDYYDKLSGLMAEWRQDWGQGNFAFFVVQLPWSPSPHREGWAMVQLADLKAWLTIPNTFTAVTVDIPLTGQDLHPDIKEPVGYRLSLGARALQYGDTGIVYSGPIYDQSGSSIQGNKIVVAFNHIGGGLVTGSIYQPAGAPAPFMVAGTDGVYHSATAQIVGDTVEVTSSSESAPVSVRYVYNYGPGNLYNAEGLPASPFEMTLSGGGGDTQAPTAPTNLTATAVSTSQINLAWTASTDNVGVTGYQIFRGGAQVGTSATTSYSDSGLLANTTYSYYVKAYDAAGNVSAPGNTAQATTFAVASPSPSPSPTPSQSPTPSPSPTPTLSPSPTPSPSPSPGGTVMHVLDIYTCDAAGVPKTAFVGGNTVYTKVQIVDATNVPVSGASVSVGYVRPGETTPWATVSGTTGADGIVTVSKALPKNAMTGTWTNKVTAVSKSGWTYDSAANVKTECTYTVS